MNGQCHQCHHTCNECRGGEPNDCTSCNKDKFKNNRYFFKGECREYCPISHYPAADKTCNLCSSNCDVCTSDTHCVKCSSGFYPTSKGCEQLKCREGEIADPDYEQCVMCAEGCEKCTLDATLYTLGPIFITSPPTATDIPPEDPPIEVK
uniref:proprotein convertase subtilisin/kexin type 5 n=1 Tax=Pristiophorus japonicus TaxID=55135 RepID=UPI00398E529F